MSFDSTTTNMFSSQASQHATLSQKYVINSVTNKHTYLTVDQYTVMQETIEGATCSVLVGHKYSKIQQYEIATD